MFLFYCLHIGVTEGRLEKRALILLYIDLLFGVKYNDVVFMFLVAEYGKCELPSA